MDRIWLYLVLIITATGAGLFRAVRARVIAGRAGIVKVCVHWVVLAIQVIFGAVLLFFGINRYLQAEKYLRAARSYEAISGRLDGFSDYNGGYLQAAMKPEAFNSKSPDSIRNNIETLRRAAEAMKRYSAFLIVISASEFLLIGTSFWYITEAGVVLMNFKVPEPFYASLNGDKIVINYTARLANVNKVKTFKATPKNLAVFGRFIVWEQEQNPQPPQNMPYVRYPQFPQSPQQPQIPQNTNIPDDKEQL